MYFMILFIKQSLPLIDVWDRINLIHDRLGLTHNSDLSVFRSTKAMSVNEVKYVKAPFQFQVKGTGNPGSRTFAIGDEDHTIGNTLRHILMQNSKVDFAGYAVPHPSEPVVNIRVQTAKTDSQISAVDALKEACSTLYDQCAFVLEQLEEVMPEAKEDRILLEERLAKEDSEALEEEEADYMDEDDEQL